MNDSASHVVDLLAQQNPDAGRVVGSFWWGLPSHKDGRQARLEDRMAMEKRLLKQDWEEPSHADKKSGQSLLCWRGLLATGNHALIQSVIDEGKGPPEDCLAWWPSAYFRERSLRGLFFPERGESEAQKMVREKLSETVAGRWPLLVEFFLNNYKSKSLYSHPLIIASRPGNEKLLEVLSRGQTYDVLLSSDSPLATPAELLLLGLRRRFEPLIAFALDSGVDVNDPILDFKGHPRSLLHATVASADHASTDWLLERGASLEQWDRHARTPFLQAARMGDVVALEKLAAAGANIHATDRHGQGAAHLVIEGINASKLDEVLFKNFGDRTYVPKTLQEFEETLERAQQALSTVLKLGVDGHAVVLPKPKKPSDSPFRDLPASPRQAYSGKPGETWVEQLSRRVEAESAFTESTVPRFRQVSLEMAWANVVAPEPEELSGDLDFSQPMPAVTAPRRPRF